MPSRRSLLIAAAALTVGGAGAAYGIRRAMRHRTDLQIAGDDGTAVLNKRLPAGTLADVAKLPGITYAGAEKPSVTLYSFSDFNCPECHAGAADLFALLGQDAGLRVGFVNNPIVSVPSAQAARVLLAVQDKAGSAAAFALYRELFGSRGRVDARKALDFAEAAGQPRAELEALSGSEAIKAILAEQMKVARELGLFATPAYVIGDVALIGHPGPKSLAAMLASLRSCDEIACG